MTLHIPLSSEAEARLRERAAALGQDTESFVLRVLQDELAADDQSPPNGPAANSSSQQKIAELRAWATGHRPLTHEADDSRESIYEGRGE